MGSDRASCDLSRQLAKQYRVTKLPRSPARLGDCVGFTFQTQDGVGQGQLQATSSSTLSIVSSDTWGQDEKGSHMNESRTGHRSNLARFGVYGVWR